MTSPERNRPGRTSAPPLEESARMGELIDGRYRIGERVGRGGMGVVYRAEQVTLRRPVAVKVLHPTLALVPELRSRFEREAQAIGRIDHPNCVAVFDFGQTPDGALYLVMELLEGESLGDLLDREVRLPYPRAIAITRHILRGLEHAHAAGIAHRDIKPENIILITHDGIPDVAKILDFGIAKLLSGETDDGVKLTQAGMAFGTPIYMSPEQAVGNPIDGRADLYGVSVMLFEMLVGTPPFFSDDKLELLSMHTTRPVPWIAELNPDVAQSIPPELETLLRRGLAKRPGERPQTASAFIAELDAIMGITNHVPGMGTGRLPTGGQSLLSDTGDVRISDGVVRAVSGFDPTQQFVDTGLNAESVSLRSGRSWWMYVLALAAIGLLVMAMMFVMQDDKKISSDVPNTPLQAAAAALEIGNAEQALKALESVPDLETSASAQLLLGHAHAAMHANKKALAAYSAVLNLDAGLESDVKLRANLSAITDDSDLDNVKAAFDLLLGKTQLTSAVDHFIESTLSADRQRRAAILPLAVTHNLSSRIDWLKVYQLDLEDNVGCESRLEAVTKLRALGDVRAIPMLQEAAVRRGKTGSYRNKPINACLSEAALSAVTYLQNLAGIDPAAGNGSGGPPS